MTWHPSLVQFAHHHRQDDSRVLGHCSRCYAAHTYFGFCIDSIWPTGERVFRHLRHPLSPNAHYNRTVDSLLLRLQLTSNARLQNSTFFIESIVALSMLWHRRHCSLDFRPPLSLIFIVRYTNAKSPTLCSFLHLLDNCLKRTRCDSCQSNDTVTDRPSCSLPCPTYP